MDYKQASTTHFASPVVEGAYESTSAEQKKKQIASHVRAIMETLGLDLDHHSLSGTPERVARMYVDEIFSGLNHETFPSMSMFEDPFASTSESSPEGTIVFTQVSIVSFCEHHLVPMIGTAYIAYIPQKHVIGLSKISRIAKFFAARPQLQERLSAQIGDSLATVLQNDNVIVLVKAKHSCVVARGAKDEQAETSTLYTSGIFKTSHERRAEFFSLVNK